MHYKQRIWCGFEQKLKTKQNWWCGAMPADDLDIYGHWRGYVFDKRILVNVTCVNITVDWQLTKIKDQSLCFLKL